MGPVNCIDQNIDCDLRLAPGIMTLFLLLLLLQMVMMQSKECLHFYCFEAEDQKPCSLNQ